MILRASFLFLGLQAIHSYIKYRYSCGCSIARWEHLPARCAAKPLGQAGDFCVSVLAETKSPGLSAYCFALISGGLTVAKYDKIVRGRFV